MDCSNEQYYTWKGFDVQSITISSSDTSSFQMDAKSLLWAVQPNDIPYQFNMDSFVGAKLSDVLGVNVFANLNAGRYSTNYCTIWSAGIYQP